MTYEERFAPHGASELKLSKIWNRGFVAMVRPARGE